MSTYLKNLYESVRQSLWLVPAVAISIAVVAAWGMSRLDAAVAQRWADAPYMYTSGADATLAILGTIAGSIITVAGVTFSITIVALTLASSQFGPRLLRNFLRSFPSQLTLGALVGSFLYGILIMPGVDSDWQSGQAHPSVTLMICLAAGCVALLVYYIHHVATSIQADSLIAAVYRELEERIDELRSAESAALEENEQPLLDASAREVASPISGYIAAIDYDRLVDWAERRNAQIVLAKRAGEHVARGECLARVAPGSGQDEADAVVARFVFINDKRTPAQDIEFLIDQLVEVALRAISPGINDPNTAIVCIDYLSAALRQLASKTLQRSIWSDRAGDWRLFCPQTDFDGLVNDAFDQLRQCGQAYPEIVIRLLASLSRVAGALPSGHPRRRSLRRQLEQIVAAEALFDPRAPKDRADIEAAIARCGSALA